MALRREFCIFEENYAMAVPSFFRQNTPKGFNYAPRYYDPVKEEREARIRAIKEEMGIKEENKEYTPGITRGSMSTYFQKRSEKVRQYTTIRLIVIILVLLLITIIFFR